MRKLALLRFGVIVAGMGVASTALATNYLLTTNREDVSYPGRRIELSTKTDGSETGIPCRSAVATVDWSPHGRSIGLAIDNNYMTNDYVWAGITGNSLDSGCGSSNCVGAAIYDISAGTVTRYFNPSWSGAAEGQSVDVMGRYPVARVAEKLYGSIEKWDVGTGTSTSLTATNVS